MQPSQPTAKQLLSSLGSAIMYAFAVPFMWGSAIGMVLCFICMFGESARLQIFVPATLACAFVYMNCLQAAWLHKRKMVGITVDDALMRQFLTKAHYFCIIPLVLFCAIWVAIHADQVYFPALWKRCGMVFMLGYVPWAAQVIRFRPPGL